MPCCTEAVELVKFLAGSDHDIEILDMHDPFIAAAASDYGIRRPPAVVIDGQIVDRCAGRDLNEVALTRQIVGGQASNLAQFAALNKPYPALPATAPAPRICAPPTGGRYRRRR